MIDLNHINEGFVRFRRLSRNGTEVLDLMWCSECEKNIDYEGGIITRVEGQIYDCIKPALGLSEIQPRQFSILGNADRLSRCEG